MIVEIPDLTAAECGDIAITAAEGGIGHWSQIESYKPSRWEDGTRDDDGTNDPEFVFYTIREDVNDNGLYEGEPIDITPSLIRRGFEPAIDEARPDLVRRLLNLAREDWTGEIDADAADVIIQLGALGEIRYG
jgi:hypothetical protein